MSPDFLTVDLREAEIDSVEAVERKGIGHPDTLADALAETVSCEYASYCLERFGDVLHHNVDKLAIGGGHSASSLGQFEFLQPVTVVLNGRMSTSFGGAEIDVRELQEEWVRRYIALFFHISNRIVGYVSTIGHPTTRSTRRGLNRERR